MRQVQIKRAREAIHSGQEALSLDEGLDQLFAMRGQSKRPDYSLNALLPPTLSGLDEAVSYLGEAIIGQKRLLVVGDFDADGATATALAVGVLQAMGAEQVSWMIPDRMRHGYGLSEAIVGELTEPKPDVILTVDQGISAHAGVSMARGMGIRVIVTDHHLPGETLPEASAIVNPNLVGDPFPSKNLSGVGVIFYVMVALRAHLRDQGYFAEREIPRLDQWLDLVAIGTVADLVTLDENNRQLVAAGLERIRSHRTREGVRALLEIGKRNLAHISASDLGFVVGPRLNAAGRLEDMGLGVSCLLETDETRARELAQALDQINQQRRELQREMQAEAEAQVLEQLRHVDQCMHGLCLYDEHWHQGIVGLVAGQLADKIQRPAIVFAPDGTDSTWLKGSGRSPGSIHMRDLLVRIDQTHPQLIERYGGHSGAAGLTIRHADLPAFKQVFESVVGTLPQVEAEVVSDGVLPAPLLTARWAKLIEKSGPWGQGFPEPLFDGRFEVVDRRLVGGSHLKINLRCTVTGSVFDAIAFRAGALIKEDLPQPWHVTYRVGVNRWRGQERLQLILQHWVVGVLDSA